MKLRNPFRFHFAKKIPPKYGMAKAFINYEGRLFVLCEKGVFELKKQTRKCRRGK